MRRTRKSSHKRSTFLERRDVFCRKFKPFPFAAPALESAKPVCFDSARVIRSERMDNLAFLGQLRFSLLSDYAADPFPYLDEAGKKKMPAGF
jgi:hypothetical protein